MCTAMTGVFGAVLCGGASRRMGVDKATMPVDGVAMARRVADALAAAGCSPVSAIGGDPAELGRLGLELIVDRYPGDGPLGGILTALAVQAPAAVVACDLPGLRAATVTSLLDALGDHDAAIAFSDRAEPLCAVWSERAAAGVASAIPGGRTGDASGNRRARHRLGDCGPDRPSQHQHARRPAKPLIWQDHDRLRSVSRRARIGAASRRPADRRPRARRIRGRSRARCGAGTPGHCAPTHWRSLSRCGRPT